MTNNYLKQFDFESWANKLTLKTMQEAAPYDERTWQLLSHMLNTHSIWLNRIKNEEPSRGSWDLISPEECAALIDENTKAWKELIGNTSAEKINELINYRGKELKFTLDDAIVFLINHSSHHRGQIMLNLKGKVSELPLTTYYAYVMR